jgi:hypothetical protein
MEQIAACIKSRSEFKNQLSVSLGDTAYNNPLCLSIAKNNVNQVHVSRSRSNKKFFYPCAQGEITDTKKRGRPKAYGDIHRLNDPETWHAPDESIELSQISGSGTIHIIKID